MSVQLALSLSMRRTKAGVNHFYGAGPDEEWLQTLSSNTGKVIDTETQTITAGQTVNLWTYSETNNISALVIRIASPTDTTGYLDGAVQGDRPTSASDTSASGLASCWNMIPGRLYYGGVWYIPSHVILTNATAALHVAGPLSAVGEEVGRIYTVQAKNNSSVSVEVQRFVLN